MKDKEELILNYDVDRSVLKIEYTDKSKFSFSYLKHNVSDEEIYNLAIAIEQFQDKVISSIIRVTYTSLLP